MVKQEINFSYLKFGLEILRVNISQETRDKPTTNMFSNAVYYSN